MLCHLKFSGLYENRVLEHDSLPPTLRAAAQPPPTLLAIPCSPVFHSPTIFVCLNQERNLGNDLVFLPLRLCSSDGALRLPAGTNQQQTLTSMCFANSLFEWPTLRDCKGSTSFYCCSFAVDRNKDTIPFGFGQCLLRTANSTPAILSRTSMRPRNVSPLLYISTSKLSLSESRHRAEILDTQSSNM